MMASNKIPIRKQALQAKSIVIESERLIGQYDMPFGLAIIENPIWGRLLITEGFGGMNTPKGGMYRWEYGGVYKLHPSDTLASLKQGAWNKEMSELTAVIECADESRPFLGFRGCEIGKLAEKAGL